MDNKKILLFVIMLMQAIYLPALTFSGEPQKNVHITEEDNFITLSNSFVSLTFNKKNADIISIKKEGSVNLLGSKGRGYLMGPGFSMEPSQFKIIRNSTDIAEISFYHEADNSFQYDLHYILRKGDSGAYCFLEQTHRQGSPKGDYGQTRWGLRADENLFDYHLLSDQIQGPMPRMSELTDKIQDWTYRLKDGTVYTKYDYSDYIEGRYVHGFAGTKSGYGIFIVQASHEYLNGGPTKQYNTVHATPFLIEMFNCGHFLLDKRVGQGPVEGDWKKLSGPFFIYVTKGMNIDDIWQKAKKKSQEEQGKWPYKWMKNEDYPLVRGTVKGKLAITNTSSAGAHIILAAPYIDWQAQDRGYIYSTRVNQDGSFSLTNVRPGSYCLYSYADDITEEYNKENIQVKADNTTDLGRLPWTPHTGTKLWQIGIADRTTKGFKLSDSRRQYGLFDKVPDSLTFTIRKSKESEDWYYAQTKPGVWTVNFTTTQTYSKGEGLLTIGIAGAAKNPHLELLLNNQQIGSYSLGNDASIYRSAILSGYYQIVKIHFPVSLIKKGNNTLSLKLINLKRGGGVMYDVVKCEIFDEKN